MKDYDSHLRDDRGLFPLSELAERSARDFGTKPAMRIQVGNDYKAITYRELRDAVRAVAGWLIGQGVQKGDNIAVLGENRPEWGISYLGVQLAGAVVVPVDNMMPAAGIRHILADSGSKILLVSGKFLPIVAEMASISTLEKIICFDENEFEKVIDWETVIREGENASVEFPVRELDELAAILYTSGTTGHSKGVMLSQRNIISNVAATSRLFPLTPDDTFLSVLPIHHSFECTAGFLLPLYCGCSITYARSIKSRNLMDDIVNTKVTMMVGVPLLFETMHTGIIRGIKKKGKKTQRLFNMVYNAVAVGEKLGMELGGKLFRDLREKAGFGTVKFFVSGGGPLNPATAVFFNRLGIRLMQGYGLTETSPVTHVNTPWNSRNETVGPLVPGVECKISNPNKLGIGEICIKGPNVFQGYYKNEEATREVFDEDGWFITGDLGIIHRDGHLQIMGRKKNMIVTGGGKNVYPEEIEHFLNRSLFIAESLVMGAPRESGYGEEVVALIYPDYEQLDIHFEQQGFKPSDQDVFNLIKSEIKDAQQPLADYKRILRFRIVEEEFQKTSTRKIKRFLYSGEMVTVN